MRLPTIILVIATFVPAIAFASVSPNLAAGASQKQGVSGKGQQLAYKYCYKRGSATICN